MTVSLKKLEVQTVVVTGASSGIGLVTARMAAAHGARLVLAARSEDALRMLTEEITGAGGQAVCQVADVRAQEDVQAIARTALEAFGGFDTWVNNAGVSTFGKLQDTPVEDMRAIFETNFWGTVYGSLEAARHLRTRGGAIINLGSALSERSVPLQGIYCASKHAIKGFTEAFRMELEADDAPISVTLIKPSAIDTPFPLHAKHFVDFGAKLPPPVYAPESVARAILYCAEHPKRDVIVGLGGKGIETFAHYAPRLMDTLMARASTTSLIADGPPPPHEQNGVDHASGNLEERGSYPGRTMETSPYTEVTLHPLRTGAVVAGAGLATAALWRASQNGDRRR